MSEIPPPPSYPPPAPLTETAPPPSAPDVKAAGPSRAYVIVLAVLGVLIIAGVATAAAMFATEDPVSTDLSEVTIYENLDNAHVLGDITYPQTPPVGGPHAPGWMECGVYSQPIPDEYAVHDLEHGTVWITHQPELSDDDVAELAELLPQNGILSPYAGQSAPVVVTVWGHQLELTGSDDPRLPLFIEEYGDGSVAPEQGVTCAGGLRVGEGGDGTRV